MFSLELRRRVDGLYHILRRLLRLLARGLEGGSYNPGITLGLYTSGVSTRLSSTLKLWR
jgi:hypothetical protein